MGRVGIGNQHMHPGVSLGSEAYGCLGHLGRPWGATRVEQGRARSQSADREELTQEEEREDGRWSAGWFPKWTAPSSGPAVTAHPHLGGSGNQQEQNTGITWPWGPCLPVIVTLDRILDSRVCASFRM